MANPLAKSIMNNISKKKIDKSNEIKKIDSIENINEKEEDILKSILYKNNSKKTSIKELANKNEVKENSNNINPKDKQHKKIISLKDLAK